MAVDSAGYNTSALFQAKSYNPNALATGLQAAAAYDPTQQSTSTPASSARFLGATNSQNVLPQDSASSSQNLQSTAPTAATAGLTAASNNSVFPSYRSNLVTTGTVSPFQQASTTAQTQSSLPNAASAAAAARTSGIAATSGTTATAGGSALTYSGPSLVHVEGSYFQFNPATGAYQYVGNYNPNAPGAANTALQSLSPAQISSATNVTGTVPYSLNGGPAQASIINQSSAFAGSLAAYQKDLANAQATQQANNIAAAGAAQKQSTLDYLTTHGGQLSAQDQQLANMQFTGSAGAQQAQQTAIQQALSDYAAQQAHSAQLAGLASATVDTSASDATDAAAQRSFASQMASRQYGADAGIASRFGAFDGAALAGQHALNHDTAAATSYNNNMQNLANALSTQYGYDKEATGNQLYSDIQGVQQVAAQLQQELGQISTVAGQRAQSNLNQLNALIQQYQQAVAAYGQGSAQAKQIAAGVLSAGGQLTAGLTGSKSTSEDSK